MLSESQDMLLMFEVSGVQGKQEVHSSSHANLEYGFCPLRPGNNIDKLW